MNQLCWIAHCIPRLIFVWLLYVYYMFCATPDGCGEELEDGKKRDRLALDICVICLEQEYNAVFIP